jgi:hypothetical protein
MTRNTTTTTGDSDQHSTHGRIVQASHRWEREHGEESVDTDNTQ